MRDDGRVIRRFLAGLLLIAVSGVVCAQEPAAAPEWPKTAYSDREEDDFSSIPVQAPVTVLEQYLGNREEFIKKVRTFDRLHTRLADTLLGQSEGLARSGDAGEAAKKLEEARSHLAMSRQAYELGLKHFDDSAFLHNFLGELLYDRFDEQDAALRHWLKAVALDGNEHRAHNNLGIHYCHVGEYEKGFGHFDKALALDPENPDYLFNVAQNYLVYWPNVMTLRGWTGAETYAEAMRLSEKAAKLAPKEFELVKDYALNFFTAERMNAKPDWKKAAKAWQAAREAARTDDERFYTWMNEGRVHLKAENGKSAVECFEAAVAMRPQSDLARGLLSDAKALR